MAQRQDITQYQPHRLTRLRVLWGSPGCCTTLRNARFGELLQHISGGVVLVVAAALTRVLAVLVGLCNACCVIMAEFQAL
jgi:hypothetical protein